MALGKNLPLRHIKTVDPRKEAFWALPSLIPQWLTIVGAVGAKVLLAIGSFWMHSPVLGTGLLVSAAWLIALLWLVRRHRLTWMLCDEQLHALAHRTRDQLDEILVTNDESTFSNKVANFESDFVNTVDEYYSRRLHNDTCGCCLRLVGVVDGKQAYLTRARSNGLGVGREETTEPIMEDSNFIRSMKNGKSLGVWILNDLNAAIESGIWPTMHNNLLDQFDSVMLAPINTVIEGKKTMTGILFVTAKGRAFQPIHTVAMKAFADHLGAVLPFLYPESLESELAKEPETQDLKPKLVFKDESK